MRRLLIPFAALCALPLLAASAALPETAAVNRGASYLRSVQLADASYGSDSFGQNMDSVFAVRAAGFDPAKDTVDDVSPVDYIVANAATVDSVGLAAKGALGALALGLDPRNVGGVDFVGMVEDAYDADSGAYAGDDFTQSIAILGLACTGNEVGANAADALRATQLDESGGWGFGGFPDPDTSAIAVQALLAAGVPASDPDVQEALAFLQASQGTDGGWGFDPTASNAASTAFVVQALLALGEDPESATYTKGGANPISFLLSQQEADGSFLGFDPTYATTQVVPALAGFSFCEAPTAPITQLRPIITPTPTATATTPVPTVTTTTPAPGTTQAPLPPSTGATVAPADSSEAGLLWGVALLTFGVAAGAAAFATRRS